MVLIHRVRQFSAIQRCSRYLAVTARQLCKFLWRWMDRKRVLQKQVGFQNQNINSPYFCHLFIFNKCWEFGDRSILTISCCWWFFVFIPLTCTCTICSYCSFVRSIRVWTILLCQYTIALKPLDMILLMFFIYLFWFKGCFGSSLLWLQ